MENKETLESALSLTQKIELREKAYMLALRTPEYDDNYKSVSEWVDYNSKKIYNWLLTGKD